MIMKLFKSKLTSVKAASIFKHFINITINIKKVFNSCWCKGS